MKGLGRIVVGATVIGVALGIALACPRGDDDPFLHGLTLTRTEVVDREPSVVASREYDVTATPDELMRRIADAYPRQFSRQDGDATQVTIPRERNGRVVLMPPPRKTITIRRLVGQSEVLVREYRVPSPLDGAIAWLQGMLRV